MQYVHSLASLATLIIIYLRYSIKNKVHYIALKTFAFSMYDICFLLFRSICTLWRSSNKSSLRWSVYPLTQWSHVMTLLIVCRTQLFYQISLIKTVCWRPYISKIWLAICNNSQYFVFLCVWQKILFISCLKNGF